MRTVVSASDLGRQYRRRWALRHCTIDIPEGAVVALVGPNGAGKTTLLHHIAGLLRPSEGRVAVCGEDPATSRPLVERIGLVAQDMPLYDSFSVGDMIRAGRTMNRRWDQASTVRRLRELSIPLDQKCGTLSGGQRSQVALAIALAKRPDVLLLDEPLAALDPLARREFVQSLMVSASESGITIVLSSHLIADLERVCDHLIVLGHGRVQAAGGIEELLSVHRLLTGPAVSGDIAGVEEVIDETAAPKGATMLVRVNGVVHDPRWTVERPGLEELVLAYLTQSSGAADQVQRTAPAIGLAS